MTKAVEIPVEQLSRAARRKAMEDSATIVINSGNSPSAIQQYIMRVYFEVPARKAIHQVWWVFESHREREYFRKVEKKLHMEVGLHLALTVAKRIRAQMEKKAAPARVNL